MHESGDAETVTGPLIGEKESKQSRDNKQPRYIPKHEDAIGKSAQYITNCLYPYAYCDRGKHMQDMPLRGRPHMQALHNQ